MFSIRVPVTKNLRTQLEQATSAVNKNTPIETCVLLEATDKGFFLTTLDSRTHQLKVRVPETEVYHQGACILPAELINKMVKTLSDDEEVQMSVDDDGNQLLIQSGSAKIWLDLYTDPADMFPVKNLPRTIVTSLDAERLSEALNKAMALSQKDEFITFVGEGDYLKIYTRFGGRMFSRTVLQADEPIEEWRVSIPTQLISRLPSNLCGTAEIRLDEDCDKLAICVGEEHLIIERLATDTTSYLVDSTVDKAAERYWVVKADSLLADLRRAAIINDKQGLKLERDKHVMVATYGAAARGNASSKHLMTETGGDIVTMHLDPGLLEKAARALDAVDLVGEQVEEVIPAALEGQKPMRFYNLRLTDQEAPDYRSVIVTTLQTD